MSAEDALRTLIDDLESFAGELRNRRSYDSWDNGYLSGIERAINVAEQSLKILPGIVSHANAVAVAKG